METRRKGAIQIKRPVESELETAPVRSQTSPLDVEGIDLGLSAEEEIVSAVREVRSGRSADSLPAARGAQRCAVVPVLGQ